MTTSHPILIRGARLIDPADGTDGVGDLLIADGIIRRVDSAIPESDLPPDCRVILRPNLVACPGFVDLHVHLREPGFEDHETIETGVRAAARGGFTTVCCMPNTRPALDNASVAEFIQRKASEAGSVRVLPIGCVSKDRAGWELAELWELAQAGVIGFSDDGSPIASAHLMRQALLYTRALHLPVIDHCEDPALTHSAPVNEGWVSNRLGMAGWPAIAEESMVARDIEMAALTGGRLHLAHLTTAGSVELVRRAKERGISVTAEVTPHHLTLSERWVMGHNGDGPLGGPLTPLAYDTATKVNPPLRTGRDAEALIMALREGVIDAVATDHAPHAVTAKLVTYDDAAFGISGLETALGVLLQLVHRDLIALNTLVERLTTGPLTLLDESCRGLGTLREGTEADVVLFDPAERWVVRGSEFVSKGKITPWEGISLQGRVLATIAGGRVVYSALEETLPAAQEATP